MVSRAQEGLDLLHPTPQEALPRHREVPPTSHLASGRSDHRESMEKPWKINENPWQKSLGKQGKINGQQLEMK